MLYYAIPNEPCPERTVRCSDCSFVRVVPTPLANIHHHCPSGDRPKRSPAVLGEAAPLHEGVGTELKKILLELGIIPGGCNCEAVAQEMNRLGPEGVRAERDRFLAHLRTAYDESSVLTKLRAWGNAKMQGKPCTIDGLLELAISSYESATASAG